MNTEVQLIIPTKYGISESNSNVIAKNCIPIIQEFNKLEIDYDSIMSEKEMTSEICKQSKALRNKYVKVRTGGDRVIQDSKTAIKKQVDAHDQLRRDFKETINEREEKLREKELHFEKIEEAKLEEIRKERNAELEKYDTVYDAGDVALLDDVLWGHFLNGVKSDYEAKKEEERKAEEVRIESERISKLHTERKDILIPYWPYIENDNEQFGEMEANEFNSLLKKVKKDKSDHDAEQEKTRIENEQLKKEAEEKRIADENAEKERQRLAKIEQDKRDKIERERLAKAESDRTANEAKAEKERLAHEAELKRVNDDRAKIQKAFEARQGEARKAEQAEVNRKKAEDEEARKAEIAPDKERLTKWVNDMSISDIVNERMSKESVLIAGEITEKFNSFKTWAKSEIEKIK